jgi:hypothetical protein
MTEEKCNAIRADLNAEQSARLSRVKKMTGIQKSSELVFFALKFLEDYYGKVMETS